MALISPASGFGAPARTTGYGPADLPAPTTCPRGGRRPDGRDRRRVRRPERRGRPRGLPRAVRPAAVHDRERLLQKVNQNGGGEPAARAGRGLGPRRSSLDLDMVSAACPNCKILLVEATARDLDLGTAVNTRRRAGRERSRTATAARRVRGRARATTATSTTRASRSPRLGRRRLRRRVPGRLAARHRRRRHHAVRDDQRARLDARRPGAAPAAAARPTSRSRRGRTTAAARSAPSPTSPRSPTRPPASPSTTPTATTAAGSSSAARASAAPIIAARLRPGRQHRGTATPRLVPCAGASLFDVVGGSNGTCGRPTCAPPSPGYDGPTGLGTPNGLGAFR